MAQATKLAQLIKKSKNGGKTAPSKKKTAAAKSKGTSEGTTAAAKSKGTSEGTTAARHANGTCVIAWESTPQIRDALKEVAGQREMSLKALLADMAQKTAGNAPRKAKTRRAAAEAE